MVRLFAALGAAMEEARLLIERHTNERDKNLLRSPRADVLKLNISLNISLDEWSHRHLLILPPYVETAGHFSPVPKAQMPVRVSPFDNHNDK